jgi:Carbohydrate family 9 binding domain-like
VSLPAWVALLALAAPKHYVCYRAPTPVAIDGRMEEAAWKRAPWTDWFVDIEGDRKPKPRFRTRVKMLWDDEFLYIGAKLEEPHVWATLTAHDSVIFQDNDFEVFIDPDSDSHEYYEFEINALNTGWDLFLPKPYKDGGKASNAWEIPGLKTAIHVRGTLNDPRDRDRGWSVEIAFPWSALAEYAHKPAPPRDGDQWRVNFSRVEWLHEILDGKYKKVEGRREDNWVWSPQGEVNMHMPERWGYVQFSTATSGRTPFQPDPTAAARDAAHRVYYAQHAFRRAHGRWAATLAELRVNEDAELLLTADGFVVTSRAGGACVTVRQDARVSVCFLQSASGTGPAHSSAVRDTIAHLIRRCVCRPKGLLHWFCKLLIAV